jgi:demethylmenaquinone methyltransferase/2-methoxy-6-polyprenyl-1,4-benzoquinol methylase
MKLSLDHFDLLAPLYETVIRTGDLQEFWKLVKIPETGFILDAGGGTGRVSRQIQNSNCEVIITDLSHPMLRESSGKGQLRPVCTPVERLPFQDCLFDRIIMVDALHHVKDQRQTASELWRVLKPGGSIIIEEPDIHRFAVKLIAIVEKIALMRSHFLDTQEISELFHFQGAKVETKVFLHNAWVMISKD